MKINVSFDMTPEEFRKILGLPDVQQMQQEVFNQVLEKMKSGEAGYEPLSLYGSMVNESFSNVEKFQQMMFSMMNSTSGKDSE